MAYRKPVRPSNRFTVSKLAQVLPICTPSNAAAATMFFQELLKRFGITAIRSYFHKLPIPIAISVIVCSYIGASSDGLNGFVIGCLLGIIAPITLMWPMVTRLCGDNLTIGLFLSCGCSSVDRVLASEAKGRGFDPRQPHQS